jgi:hydroxymethylpyrimidine/phosphomethylpyrimidine kinase
MIATALSIAGSDPSGGAGIQADLKTFSACGVYGMCALTALTAQNTTGVSKVHLVPPAFVSAQIKAIFDDIRVNAVKIGMIANAEIGHAVADTLENLRGVPIVLDPVMIAKGGHSLLADDAVSVLKQQLLPLADILTPNLPEAASLLGENPAQSRDEIEAQGRALLNLGPKAVLMKGGHLQGSDSPDLLVTKTNTTWLETERIETKNTHGTGCTLSAAIAAEMAKGEPIEIVVRKAKTYVLGAIANADKLQIGAGHGPTHHFHQLWKTKL